MSPRLPEVHYGNTEETDDTPIRDLDPADEADDDGVVVVDGIADILGFDPSEDEEGDDE
jgi:hypothetical protein